MNGTDIVFDLSTVAVIVGNALVLAAGYFTLKGRVDAADMRMNNFSQRLDKGDQRFAEISGQQQQHSERLTRIETLLETIDDKINHIAERIK